MKVFFSTDIHGSELCFRKFLNAREFYQADVLMLGGDLCAGSVVFAREAGKGWELKLSGRDVTISNRDELEKLRSDLANRGHLLKLLSHQDTGTENPGYNDANLKSEFQTQLRHWVDLAASKSAHPIYYVPGNDDPFYSDEVLTAPFINLHRRHVLLDDETSILGLGGSTPTPWKTEREYSDMQLESFIAGSFDAKLKNTGLILLSHCPPYNCGLDMAPALLDDFSYELHLGVPRAIPVGSRAVSKALLELMPMLGLYGHVHEGRGYTKVHETLCINPGSVFWTGRLQGCLVEIQHGKIVNFQLTEG